MMFLALIEYFIVLKLIKKNQTSSSFLKDFVSGLDELYSHPYIKI